MACLPGCAGAAEARGVEPLRVPEAPDRFQGGCRCQSADTSIATCHEANVPPRGGDIPAAWIGSTDYSDGLIRQLQRAAVVTLRRLAVLYMPRSSYQRSRRATTGEDPYVTSIPFTDMPALDFIDYPESGETAVIRAALWAERIAEESFGWDNTAPITFHFLGRPGREEGPVAAFIPMDMDPGRPPAPQLLEGAKRLRTDRSLRRTLGRETNIHLGVGLIHEADFALSRRRVRQVVGVFAEGQPFAVKRIRGQEPTVDLREVPITGAGGDLFAALREINTAFKRVQGRLSRRS